MNLVDRIPTKNGYWATPALDFSTTEETAMRILAELPGDFDCSIAAKCCTAAIPIQWKVSETKISGR